MYFHEPGPNKAKSNLIVEFLIPADQQVKEPNDPALREDPVSSKTI